MSWDERFAARYEEWSSIMTEDVPFYAGLAAETDGPLVELGVGNGRVAVPVAHATGRTVIGIDSSPAMLELCARAAADAGVDVELREGDMADLTLNEPAALIYCPFRALLHLPTWADRRRTFERVAAALRPGGRFAWNVFAFDHHVAVRLDGEAVDAPVPHSVHYDIPDNRIDLTLDDGATSSLWWATKNEWLGLLDVAGLELEALYGDFDRSPLGVGGTHSADLIIRSYDFAAIETLQQDDRWDEAGALLAADARRLQEAGAALIVLCTNTMHVCAPAIEAAIDVPFLHLADTTARAVRDVGVSTVALRRRCRRSDRRVHRDRTARRRR